MVVETNYFIAVHFFQVAYELDKLQVTCVRYIVLGTNLSILNSLSLHVNDVNNDYVHPLYGKFVHVHELPTLNQESSAVSS